MISWGCLLVEDSDKEQIVNIYAWIYISGLIAAFFAPISGIFIGIFSLVPTIRVLYLISFIFMTLKFIVLNRYCTETIQGKVRMKETKGVSILKLLSGYGSVIKEMLKTTKTMLTLGIMLIMSIISVVNNTFGWISGNLSGIDRRLPFVMNIILLAVGIVLTYYASNIQEKRQKL